MRTPVRSWLYAPGHHLERVLKALRAGADAVVIDLEDSVPSGRKEEARVSAADILRDRDPDHPEVWDRINPAWSRRRELDLIALADMRLDGVRVPMSEAPVDVKKVAAAVGCPLPLLVESAQGLMVARELVTADSAVGGIGLGEADLAADPSSRHGGVRVGTGMCRRRFSRSRPTVPPCRASRRTSPTSKVSVRRRRPPAPTDSRGEATALTVHGRFVDPAAVSQAQLVLELDARAPTAQTPADNPSEEHR